MKEAVRQQEEENDDEGEGWGQSLPVCRWVRCIDSSRRESRSEEQTVACWVERLVLRSSELLREVASRSVLPPRVVVCIFLFRWVNQSALLVRVILLEDAELVHQILLLLQELILCLFELFLLSSSCFCWRRRSSRLERIRERYERLVRCVRGIERDDLRGTLQSWWWHSSCGQFSMNLEVTSRAWGWSREHRRCASTLCCCS